MATLTAKLTLTSANATTDSLNLNVSETLTVGEPAVNVSRVSVLHSAATDILVAANAVTTGAAELFGILWPNQWMFINILDAEGLKAQANNATCIVEYGYWTKA